MKRLERTIFKTLLTSIVIVSIHSFSYCQNFTLTPTTSIPPLAHSRAEWVDFNNDELPDFFLTGITITGIPQTQVYFQTTPLSFNVVALTPLVDVDMAFNDFNLDGFVDIIYIGADATGNPHTLIYQNNNGQGFLPVNHSLPGVSNGSVLWHDLDRDGDADVLLTGMSENSLPSSAVFENVDGNYNPRASQLPEVFQGESVVADHQNDGIPEVLLTGINDDGNFVSTFLSVDTAFHFTALPISITPTAFNSIAMADFNSDGNIDIAISGFSGISYQPATIILINQQPGGYMQLANDVPQLSSSSIDATDLNNDGTPDLILTGQDAFGFNHFTILNNTGNLNFQPEVHSIASIFNGDVTIADIDGDGDNDIFQTGNSDVALQSNVFLSDQAELSVIASPGEPGELTTVADNHTVTLQWSPATDDVTPGAALRYNVYIRNADGELIISPLASLTNGASRYQSFSSTSTQRVVHNLPEGGYSWSVQSIDAAGNSSVFAPENTFAICHDISLGNDTAICQGSPITFTRAEPDEEVQWHSVTNGLLVNGDNEITWIVDASDTIILQIHKPFGCVSADTIIVKKLELPTIDLGNDQAICELDTVALSINQPLEIEWFRDEQLVQENTPTFQYVVFAPSTVVAQVKDFHQCVNRDTVIIDVKSRPVFSAGLDREVCPNDLVHLEVTNAWPVIKWTDAETGEILSQINMLDFAPAHPGSIISQITGDNGCTNSDTVNIILFTPPQINLGSDKSICYGENVVIEANGTTGTIEWFDIDSNTPLQTSELYSFHSIATRIIVGRVTDANGCIAQDTTVVAMQSLPQVNIGSDTAVCLHEQILLKTSTGLKSVEWRSLNNVNEIISNDWFLVHQVETRDTLTALVEAHDGCLNRDTIVVTAKQLPDFTLGEDRTVCELDTIELSIPGDWGQVHFFTGDILLSPEQSLTFTVQESIDVWTRVVGHNGCIAIDTIHILSDVLPRFDLGPPISICQGDTLHLNAPVSVPFYQWRNRNSQIISISEQFNYSFQISDAITLTLTDDRGCKFQDSLLVNLHPIPEPIIDGPIAACEGDSVKYSVPIEMYEKIVWATQQGTSIDSQSLELVAQHSTTYSVNVTDLNGCEGSQSIELHVWPTPVADAGQDTLICEGAQVSIGTESTFDAEYSWSPISNLSDATTATPTASPTTTTTYELTVTTPHGCTDKDSVTVRINPKLEIEAGADQEVCIGDSVKLGNKVLGSTGDFPHDYNWTDTDASFSSDERNPTVTPTISTMYYLFASNGNCGVELDSVFVHVHQPPAVVASPDVSIGVDGSVVLSVSGAQSYTWSPQETLDNPYIPNPTATPLTTTLYTVLGTDMNGCQDTAQVIVHVQNAIFIPNLFSPNGDQSNDVFKIYGSGFYNLTLSVYDDTGTRVFHTSDKITATTSGWDGTFQGRNMINGSYYWKIDGHFTNGERVHFQNQTTGIIKLLR